MLSKNIARIRLYLIAIAILVILSLNSWFLYSSFKGVSENETWVIHTYEVDLIFSSVKDAETGPSSKDPTGFSKTI
tara:strand:- start:13957 stop:14184 length:228 start_codon:yes stop_codon:yes gene_type:complete